MFLSLKSKFTANENEWRKSFPKYEFHIAKKIRLKYGVDDEFFSISGNVVFVNNQAARRFAKLINDKRDASSKIRTGEINAAGLLDEIYHYIFRLYEIQINPGVVKKALDSLNEFLGEEKLRKLLFDFTAVFPPLEVFKGKESVYDYLNSFGVDRSNAEIVLEEMILLSFANINPANKNILELFDQNYLTEKEHFEKAISYLEKFFKEEKKIGLENQDLFSFFKTPISLHPLSIEEQLNFIREKWGVLLDEKLLMRILSGKDLLREDDSFGGVGGGGAAPTIAPIYKSKMGEADFLRLGKSGYKYAEDIWKEYEEPENFTEDIDWMPKVVVLAKNTYVWLDQLSKKYGRYIRTLNQIPDEELDKLANWGFNGLWLIGIWERSNASRKIKHIMGNIDAVASAYSLYDYQIAWDLGGEEAYKNLNDRARSRGIRLASDMVPNHTGIFSKWVVEHPDYFIQSNYPPFPNYRFTGPDLSDDPSIQLKIEDGYWSRSDAAVVFQRIDNRTGDVRYIYHGNDGTNMPWNDTAQLNMIKAEVREAVIQKIFEVARKFSIIRFDAAMTLAKKHFSRLWYPQPGKGGDIPSRADYSLTQSQFDELFPVEFWREVVDRINSEMPETLLLAEAFWLMEGYFVRSLGMHRVYNSAFMHMMMKEENDKYRDLITNTLEFEPEILKRYVNFMSNPDEETAIKQFGTDDKYFGVCTMMVTLPGLPMFAHGQIEGFTEKYGMEYQRAYYHENPNPWLVERHEREIFPLVRKRYLFSDVANFWFFDFIDGYGQINENVFAFTNFEHGERVIVFYNNKYDYTSGKIYKSTPKLVNKSPKTKTLANALHINKSEKHYYIYREHVSNLEFIKAGKDFEHGFDLELNGFKYAVFMDFREVYDENGEWGKLCKKLNFSGVPNIARAFAESILEPVHNAFEELFDEESINGFIKSCIIKNGNEHRDEDKIPFIDRKFNKLLKSFNKNFNLSKDTKPILNNFDTEILAVAKLNDLLDTFYPAKENLTNTELHKAILTNHTTNYHENSVMFFLYLVVSNIGGLLGDIGEINTKNYVEKALLDKPVKNILKRLGKGEYEIYRGMELINILLELFDKSTQLFAVLQNQSWANEANGLRTISVILENENVQKYIGVHEFEGISFYSKENFDEFLSWSFTIALIKYISRELVSKIKSPTEKHELDIAAIKEKIDFAFESYKTILTISHNSEYKFNIFKENILDAFYNK
jgi:glycosidase